MSAAPAVPTYERKLIGGILAASVSALAVAWPKISESGILPGHFGEPRHREAFKVLSGRIAAGRPCDPADAEADLAPLGFSLLDLQSLEAEGPMTDELPHLARQIVDAAAAHRYELALRDGLRHLEGGASAADVHAQIAEAGAALAPSASRILPAAVDAARWSGEVVHPPRQLIEGILDAGAKALIVGPSKCRKSFFGLQLAQALAAGRDTLGLHVAPARVLLWQAEVPPEHYHRRLVRMMDALEVDAGALGDRLQIVHGRGFRFGLHHGPALVEMVKRYNADVLMLDPVYRFLVGNESDPEAVGAFLRMLDPVAETGCTVALIHHAPKGIAGDRQVIDRSSGSGYWARDMDAQLCLTPHRDDGLVVLETVCRSYPPREAVTLTFSDAGCFELSDVAPVVRTSQNIRRGAAGAAPTLEDAASALGSGTSTFNILLGRLRERGFTRDGARSAVDEMLAAGTAAKWREPIFQGAVHYGRPEAVAKARERYERPALEVGT